MRLFGIYIFVATTLAHFSVPVYAEGIRCHIGKMSYCAKYGGSRCEKTNSAGAAACAKWENGCYDCHNDIPACLHNVRPDSESPLCNSCAAKWDACMKNIYRRFWPNRLSRN